ncbi:hypothetical protein [Flavilitoribacter nigricans]|uniref:Uncharacterized protein n=1 Tax=Flavilitoribacter nigricans (strain ATCC 23147 / DSM 23189 / NBRC 102662 / NCIMB 1420 / SS-2) TaxID=1122177 RepID=A0A2D0NBK6_FLAN2|nr:hypothetical protein [Flavilitoribacter nigricans]PHN05776.1 hypothetical protein CRP01_14985 [Flavilitoribacter nigricans DSM 23189 = NBRC 102662]
MRNFFLERQLRRIERDVSDDLLMILEVGPQYYSNQELYELTDELQQQEEISKNLQRNFFLFLVSIPLWVCAYFLSNAFGWHAVARIFLYMIPVAGLIFATGSFYCRYQYRNCRHANLIRSIIQQELERRRKDASIS